MTDHPIWNIFYFVLFQIPAFIKYPPDDTFYSLQSFLSPIRLILLDNQVIVKAAEIAPIIPLSLNITVSRVLGYYDYQSVQNKWRYGYDIQTIKAVKLKIALVNTRILYAGDVVLANTLLAQFHVVGDDILQTV